MTFVTWPPPAPELVEQVAQAAYEVSCRNKQARGVARRPDWPHLGDLTKGLYRAQAVAILECVNAAGMSLAPKQPAPAVDPDVGLGPSGPATVPQAEEPA